MTAPGHATTYGGMLAHLGRLLWSYPRWRTLLAFYGTVFVTASASALLRGKKPRRQRKDPAKKPARKGLGKGFKQQFLTLIRIAIPGLGSTAALRLYVYTALNLLRGYLNIKLVLVGSTGLQRITEMDWHKMFYQQSIYMSLCVPLAALNAGMRYVQNRLALVSHTPRRSRLPFPKDSSNNRADRTCAPTWSRTSTRTTWTSSPHSTG